MVDDPSMSTAVAAIQTLLEFMNQNSGETLPTTILSGVYYSCVLYCVLLSSYTCTLTLCFFQRFINDKCSVTFDVFDTTRRSVDKGNVTRFYRNKLCWVSGFTFLTKKL